MSLKSEVISWGLVAALSFLLIFQYLGANRAEQKAQDAENSAKALDAKLKDFMSQSETREKEAEAKYQASLQESADLRAILAKGSQRKPIPAVPSPSQPLSAVLQGGSSQPVPVPGKSPASPACDAFIYKGEQLLIDQFQVVSCDGKALVEAEAAVELKDSKAQVDKLTAQLADEDAKLVLTQKDLELQKAAEAQWKKAAKKSRIKRVLGVAEKVGLFAAGVYLGHRF